MVAGLLARKLGMTRVLNDDGTVSPVTVLRAGPCTVTDVRTLERDGYRAVQMGFDETRRLNRPESGHLRRAGGLFRYLREVAPGEGAVQVGDRISVELFQPGDRVDVIGTSRGKGFAGTVKRHGFGGGPKTHGQADRLRAPGAIGGGTDPGRVLKGKKMAGHMGARRTTVSNLRVERADPERHLLLVRGAVPGARNSLTLVRRSRKERKDGGK